MNIEEIINYIERYKHHEDGFDDEDRMNLKHNIFSYIWQRDFSSKIEERLVKENTKVIDLGCGTGQWLMNMSSKYPLSTFIGIDTCSKFFPSQENKPSNVAFLQHNLLEHPGIPFPDGTFDFVYLRGLSATFEENDWRHVMNEIVRVTNVNGCVEIMDFAIQDIRENIKGPIMSKLSSSFIKFIENKNIKLPSTTELSEYLNQTNQISDVQLEMKSSPLGSWGGQLGEIILMDLIMLFRRFKASLIPFLKITGKEYDQLLNELDNECFKYRPHYYSYRLYGKNLELDVVTSHEGLQETFS